MAVLSPPEPKADKKSKESNGKSNGADDDGEESSDFDEVIHSEYCSRC